MVRLRVAACVLLVCGLAGGVEAVAAEPDPVAKQLARYEYPDCPNKNASTGGRIHHVQLSTPDSFETVLKWYEKATGAELEKGKDGKPELGTSVVKNETDGTTLLSDESSREGKGVKPRPVRMCVLVRNAKSHYVTVVLSQAEGEKHTYITVTYVPKQ